MKQRVGWVLCAAAVSGIIAGGCKKQTAAPAMPPPEVEVAHPEQKDVTVYLKYPGQVRAKEIVDIEARVRGYLETVDFVDGAMVKKGQQLFTIEKTVYEARVAQAKAAIAKAQADAKVTETSLKRMQDAYKTKAVSEIDLLVAEGKYEAAKAGLQAAEAALKSAEQDLSYCTVTAPVTGRISRHFISVGNLVGTAGSTKLAELVTIDPIQTYFNVDERTSLEFIRQAGGVRGVVKPGSYKVKLQLADGKEYEADGDVDYVGNTVDRQTGTISVRAVFPNKNGILISGMFAKILVPKEYKQAILVPAAVIQRDMVGRFVYVVNADSKVESRYVTLGPVAGNSQIITKGLKKDDRVIVKGMIKVRPGMPVAVQDAAVAEGPESKPQKTEE